MTPAVGFAWLDLAATQTRYARERLRSSAEFVSADLVSRDLSEWLRLKREARSAILKSALCDRPRLP